MIKKLIFFIVSLLLITSPLLAEEYIPNAEVGDAVYHKGFTVWFITSGNCAWHGGLFWYKKPNEEASVIQASGPANGVEQVPWTKFLDNNPYGGSYSYYNDGLSMEQRKTLLKIAQKQLSAYYCVTDAWDASQWGHFIDPAYYKTPNVLDDKGNIIKKGYFRCDGLIEYCYEQIGYDIGDDSDLISYYPQIQAQNMATSSGQKPLLIVKDPMGTLVDALTTSPTLNISVDEGANGSGLAFVQITSGDGTKVYKDDSISDYESFNNYYKTQVYPNLVVDPGVIIIQYGDRAGHCETKTITVIKESKINIVVSDINENEIAENGATKYKNININVLAIAGKRNRLFCLGACLSFNRRYDYAGTRTYRPARYLYR